LVDIRTAHRMPDGSKVEIEGLNTSTSGELDEFIYAQIAGRCAGIRVIPDEQIDLGTTFTAKGVLGHSGGERTFSIYEITSSSPGSAPDPLFMTTKCLGGPGEVINTPSSVGAVGLRTTGLLVKICGIIRYNGIGDAYIDDGAGMQNDPEVSGCRIALEDLLAPPVLPSQGFVCVTGISGVAQDLLPVIRPLSISSSQ